MFCRLCQEFAQLTGTKSSYQKGGSTNFHIKVISPQLFTYICVSCVYTTLQSLRKHEASAGHIRCKDHKKALDARPGTMPAHQSFRQLNEAQISKLTILFRTAHAIAKKGRPFSDFIWMVELHEVVGSQDLGETYHNDKACRTFVSSIAEAERQKLVEDMSKAPFFSIMTDGTTDAAVSEAEIMYVW
jgi:hypothetical protein